MKNITLYTLFFLALMIAFTLLERYVDRKRKKELYKQYRPAKLLTEHELKFLPKLQQWAGSKGLIICPKVRLLDIIEPKPGNGKLYYTLLNKVSSKHIDFVLCDKAMQIKLLVELDDRSHARKDRKERDEFVNSAVQAAGYPIVHIYDDDPMEKLENAMICAD